MKKSCLKIFKNQSGYSVIESLTALALLTAVLLPACALTARLVSSQMVQTKVTGIILAQKYMEQTIAKKEFISFEWKTRQNSNNWIIRRSIDQGNFLAFITIEVFSERNNKCVYLLRTCRPLR